MCKASAISVHFACFYIARGGKIGKMALSLEEICTWAETDKTRRNFMEGKRALAADHILSCGKNVAKSDNETLQITAFCLSTSQLKKSRPHTIEGKIKKNGTIISMSCSCKAGLGEQCKHVIATLLCIHRYLFSNFYVFSNPL